MKLNACGNTEIPCYLVLLKNGYHISKKGPKWEAIRGDDNFIADDLSQLLGIVTLAEARGEDWLATDAEIENFLQLYKTDSLDA